jgi:hypothetical protein
LAGAIKRFDFKMLLDPFEEQFNLPSFSVELRDRHGIKHSIVGNEPINDIGSVVFIYNHPEWLGVILSRLIIGKPDHLVADNPGLQISRAGAFNGILHVVFCHGNEESPPSMDKIEQTEKIQVSFIYRVNSSRFYINFIEYLDIMDGSLSQPYKNREVAFEVQLGMYLDTAFVFPEGSPWAELQAQADRTAVKGIDKVVDVKPEVIVVLIHRSGDVRKYTGKIGIYSPVAIFVCFG